MRRLTRLLFAGAAFALFMAAGCAEQARGSVERGSGPSPALPDPVKTLIPTVKVAA